MFRAIRIVILLFILINVALGTWLTRVRSTSWEQPLRMVVFPINGDGLSGTHDYVRALTREDFQAIDDFMGSEAQRYDLHQRDPLDVFVADPVEALPPAAPHGGNLLQVALWSLRLRYWAWRHADYDGPDPDVRMFVLYHDPAHVDRLPHSLGLQKGLIGVVYAFASPAQAQQNNVVIAHELLHTLGATDKYDSASNQPSYPDGFAEPDKTPLYPQRFAEIMAGRIPLDAGRADMPANLEIALIGSATAREIRWRD
ncbi:MAG: hypothetical protein KIS79_07375 [Burkholderiales bacterium]|nr:hypothetical protein [Burkholderiales bacterium]